MIDYICPLCHKNLTSSLMILGGEKEAFLLFNLHFDAHFSVLENQIEEYILLNKSTLPLDLVEIAVKKERQRKIMRKYIEELREKK